MAGEPDPSATSARTCAGREEMGIVPEALQNRAHFFPLLFSLCLGVEIFCRLGFSGLGFSGLTVAWVLGVGGVWVDGGLGFGLGVVVEPWVWVAVGLPCVWVDGGLGFGLGVVVEPWVWVAVGLPCVWVDGGLGFGLGVVVEPWVWVAVGLEHSEENRNEEREKKNEEREKKLK
uniref:Uncharacterized protein n=1 Tax=Fagus sylvatica TaxID=28930 RepID=A0A2N9HQP3_FAGSY